METGSNKHILHFVIDLAVALVTCHDVSFTREHTALFRAFLERCVHKISFSMAGVLNSSPCESVCFILVIFCTEKMEVAMNHAKGDKL